MRATGAGLQRGGPRADTIRVGVLTWVAQTLNGFFESAPPIPVVVVAAFVVEPLLVLVHELGHALAARALLDTDVVVAVGSKGTLLDRHIGRVHLYVNAFGGVAGASGVAGFDWRGATARDVVLITLAGPVASLAGALLAAWLLGIAPAHGVVHALLWAATFGGVLGALNALPFRFQQRRGDPVHRSDGRLALEAFTASRRQRARG